MPSEHVIDKATKFLKGNAVDLAGASRYYTVGLPGYRVDINTTKDGRKTWRCDCEHGRPRGDNDNIEDSCSHVIAALMFDMDLSNEVERRRLEQT